MPGYSFENKVEVRDLDLYYGDFRPLKKLISTWKIRMWRPLSGLPAAENQLLSGC